ncbi:hypothetical protein Ga0100231_017765 [Opitutaceae bacterium TAV4]|nr:hypothetical protein Ga0100231_017765 [Opitutaceae bacterium TAV4]
MRRPHSDVAQASRLQSSLLREAPHSIKVTALRAIDKMAGRMPALRYDAGFFCQTPAVGASLATPAHAGRSTCKFAGFASEAP